MANVSFKLGLQSAIDQLLIAKSGAEEGSFYLTSDTHRLYIGGKASPSDTDVQVFPVNEGVTTVNGIVNLPTYDTDAQKDAAAGRFYYVADANILCVYNGQDWIQINANDDTGIERTEYVFSTPEDNPRAVEVFYTITDSNNRGHVSRYTLLGTDGVSTTFTESTIEIKGNKYNLSTEKKEVEGSDTFEIILGSDGLEEVHKVILLPGKNVYLSSGTLPNEITINAEDTKIESMEILEGYSNATKEGYRIKIKDTLGNSVESSVNPKIKYGTDTGFHVVKFDENVARLDVYTREETDALLQALNAMTYKGTIGLDGSFANSIGVAGNETHFYAADSSSGSVVNVSVPVSIGDVVLCKTGIDYNGRTLTPGTMIVCRSKTEEENGLGYIDPANLVFDIIESTTDNDTTYRLRKFGENGFSLSSSANAPFGSVQFKSGSEDVLNITSVDEIKNGDYVDKEIIIEHREVIRNSTTADGEHQSATTKMTIPVIVEVESDDYGHVTGIKTADYEVIDTSSQISLVDVSANQYVASDNKTQVGSFTTQITTTDGASKQTMQEDSFNIISKTLEIKVNNNYGATSGTETTRRQGGLSINMVWGEF